MTRAREEVSGTCSGRPVGVVDVSGGSGGVEKGGRRRNASRDASPCCDWQLFSPYSSRPVSLTPPSPPIDRSEATATSGCRPGHRVARGSTSTAAPPAAPRSSNRPHRALRLPKRSRPGPGAGHHLPLPAKLQPRQLRRHPRQQVVLLLTIDLTTPTHEPWGSYPPACYRHDDPSVVTCNVTKRYQIP